MLSFPQNIKPILELIHEYSPQRILDIGGGMGKYALLIREQELSKKAEGGDMMPKSTIIIDCNEDNPFFTNQVMHDKLYDNHYHESAYNLKTPNNYDITLLIDVVEHWKKKETKELLSKINGLKLISTPKNTSMYDSHFYGDPRHHITQWSEKDFNTIIEDISTDLSHIFLIK